MKKKYKILDLFCKAGGGRRGIPPSRIRGRGS